MSVFYNKLKYRTFKNTGFWLVLYFLHSLIRLLFHPNAMDTFYLQGVSQTFCDNTDFACTYVLVFCYNEGEIQRWIHCIY